MKEFRVKFDSADKTPTQMYYAKKGVITPEMNYVAQVEALNPELVRNEVAAGKMIIPANIHHENLLPMAIGREAKTKINANIGNSSLSSDICAELEKLQICLKYGADTVMDLSTGGDLDAIRSAIIANSSVPIGTVPMYQIIHDIKEVENLTASDILKTLEKQARQGVSYFTIHAGFLLKFMPLVAKRKMGIVSRGGSLTASWMMHHHKENPFYEAFDDILEICAAHDVALSLGDGLRPGCLYDATDEAQLSELRVLGELTLRAWEKNVQVMIEGPGHIPLNQIEYNMKIEQELCHDAPFYVLGPLVTDIGAGYDHITSAIGGTLAAVSGADFLCYVTPAEHLALPTLEDVHDGVIASRIAAHAADIVKGVPGAAEWDREMARARKILDWETQMRLAIDPPVARAKRAQREAADTDACSMCGNYCAVKIVGQYMNKDE